MFGRGGDDAVAHFASDFVMNPVEEEPSYGRAAIRDNFQRFASAWDDLQVAAEQFIDDGDRVFVGAHFRGRGRASGRRTWSQSGAHFRFRCRVAGWTRAQAAPGWRGLWLCWLACWSHGRCPRRRR